MSSVKYEAMEHKSCVGVTLKALMVPFILNAGQVKGENWDPSD